MSGLNRAE